MTAGGNIEDVRRRKKQREREQRPDPYAGLKALPQRPMGAVPPGFQIIEQFGKPDRRV